MAKQSKPVAVALPTHAPIATPVVVTVVQGMHGGVPLAALPANIAARGAGVGKATPAQLAVRVVVGARACKVRAPHCVQWWQATQATLATAGAQGATLGALASANVPTHFATYAVRHSWLAYAPAGA